MINIVYVYSHVNLERLLRMISWVAVGGAWAMVSWIRAGWSSGITILPFNVMDPLIRFFVFLQWLS